LIKRNPGISKKNFVQCSDLFYLRLLFVELRVSIDLWRKLNTSFIFSHPKPGQNITTKNLHTGCFLFLASSTSVKAFSCFFRKTQQKECLFFKKMMLQYKEHFKKVASGQTNWCSRDYSIDRYWYEYTFDPLLLWSKIEWLIPLSSQISCHIQLPF